MIGASYRGASRLAMAWLAVPFALGLPHPAVADYRLQPGDVIELSVAGLPELHQTLPVQLDGSVEIARIGTIVVEGAPIDEVRSSIQSAFASRVLNFYGPDGREFMRTVESQDVAVVIAGYRPIWVSGAVVQPGEKPYQPRMTVRQAIASAGGVLSPLPPPSGVTYDPIKLREEYVVAWLDLAAQAVRRWRLDAELGDDSEFDASAIPPSPLPEQSLSRFLAGEEDIRRSRELDRQREVQFLEHTAELTDEEITTLAEQLKLEEQGEADDHAEYDRVQELLAQGRITNNRLVDARRALLFSGTRRLQTANDLMQARRRLAEYRRELEGIDHRRRVGILEELQTTMSKVAEARTRLGGVEEKLRLAGTVVPGMPELSGSPEITLIQRDGDGARKIAAGYEDEVSPGDVVEVVWRPNVPAAAEQTVHYDAAQGKWRAN
jgi:polysaccharide biosynthesis/export protein